MGQSLSVEAVLEAGAELLGVQLSYQLALSEALGQPLNPKEAAHQLAAAAGRAAGITDPAAVERIANHVTACRPAVQCSACSGGKDFGHDFAS